VAALGTGGGGVSLPFGLLGRVRDLETKVADAESNITTNETAIEKLTTVKDLTSATEDYALSVNETAKIDISAASTDLHIALEDGVYEIFLIFSPATFASDRVIGLLPNGQQYANEFTQIMLRGDTSITTDEVDVITQTLNNHRFSGVALKPNQINSVLTISGNMSYLMSEAVGTNSGNLNITKTSTTWDQSTAHESAGSIEIGEAATGVCYVKRIA
jgi:hypothetical protein